MRIVLVQRNKIAYHAWAEDNLTTALDIRIIRYSRSTFYMSEEDNKLASLEAMLVRNTAHPPT